MKVKDIASITVAPMEIVRYKDDGEPESIYSIYGPSDIKAMPAEIASLDVDSIDQGREAIIITV